MASPYSNPQRIYLKRVTDPNTGEIEERTLCIVYPNPAYAEDITLPPYITDEYALTVLDGEETIYKGIKITIDLTGKMTIDHPASELTSYLVKSTILFEFDSNKGEILGGKLNYKCQDPTSNVHLCLNGESSYSKDLTFGPKNELHLSIIGVDDIRARTQGGTPTQYSQLYALRDQILFLKIAPIIGTSNNNIVVQYKKRL
ncbi:MAG: hypothetical protein JKY03_01635 [Aureispira sp.]|nr:hypothetical protein [Aureispira sp.]